MIKKFLIGVAILGGALVIFIANRPSEFRVSRSAVIPAVPALVFPHVNDLHQWEDWSPWLKLDPQATATFEGPESGVGSSMAWDGNREVGKGKMTITESKANELIEMKLEFVKPFAGTSLAEFTFKPEGEGTQVSWTMTGQNDFMGKAVGLIIDCDKMVGGQFEQGLANLKAIVAKP